MKTCRYKIASPVENYIEGAKVANDKLFCSLSPTPDSHFIKVMDLSTLTFIKSIEIPERCSQLIPMGNNQLLGIHYRGFFILDTESLEIVKSTEVFITSNHVALNESENVLYYLQIAAQPSPVPYILSKLNLSNGESSYITGVHDMIVGPITYDKKAKVIVSGGGLKIFSTDGEVLKVVELPANTSHIFIK